jgi:hypothetical protein
MKGAPVRYDRYGCISDEWWRDQQNRSFWQILHDERPALDFTLNAPAREGINTANTFIG